MRFAACIILAVASGAFGFSMPEVPTDEAVSLFRVPDLPVVFVSSLTVPTVHTSAVAVQAEPAPVTKAVAVAAVADAPDVRRQGRLGVLASIPAVLRQGLARTVAEIPAVLGQGLALAVSEIPGIARHVIAWVMASPPAVARRVFEPAAGNAPVVVGRGLVANEANATLAMWGFTDVARFISTVVVRLPEANAPPAPAFLRAHGHYRFTEAGIAGPNWRENCRAAYARMREAYPVPCITINDVLLEHYAAWQDLMDVFGGAPVAVWIDTTDATARTVNKLAAFLSAYQKQICILMVAAAYADPNDESPIPAFWCKYLTMAAPGRKVLYTQGAWRLDKSDYTGASGAGIVHIGNLNQWLDANYTATIVPTANAALGKAGYNILAEWYISAPLLMAARQGRHAPRLQRAAKQAAVETRNGEKAIQAAGFNGLVRVVGEIPQWYAIFEDMR